MPRRIGIYSGTFDPLHAGHTGFALAAAAACRLETVYLLPEPLPRDKPSASDVQARLGALCAAARREPRLQVLMPPNERFTVQQTLPALLALFKNERLTLLLGSDVARSLPHRWPDLGRLLRHASLAIGLRADAGREEMDGVMAAVAQQTGCPVRYTLVEVPFSELSSSAVREQRSGVGPESGV